MQIGGHQQHIYTSRTERFGLHPLAVEDTLEFGQRPKLDDYGDTALLFEIVFFTTTPDFNTYADAQQKVNLAIIERLRQMKVSFAAPMRAVVVIEKPPGTD